MLAQYLTLSKRAEILFMFRFKEVVRTLVSNCIRSRVYKMFIQTVHKNYEDRVILLILLLKQNYLCFAGEEAEAQRMEIMCSRSFSWELMSFRCGYAFSASKAFLSTHLI